MLKVNEEDIQRSLNESLNTIAYFELSASYWVSFSLISFPLLEELYHLYQFAYGLNEIAVSSPRIRSSSRFQIFIEKVFSSPNNSFFVLFIQL